MPKVPWTASSMPRSRAVASMNPTVCSRAPIGSSVRPLVRARPNTASVSVEPTRPANSSGSTAYRRSRRTWLKPPRYPLCTNSHWPWRNGWQCHPFRHGQWLFVHNGYLGGFNQVRRDLLYAVDPELFAGLVGSTDTEAVFGLALTNGLTDDPIGALEHTVGFIEATARERGIEDAVQGTFGITNGETLWAVRYATKGPPRSLFATVEADTIRKLHPDNPRLQRLS